MAFFGWPVSQCQALDTPLAMQLTSGVRVLDIRLAVINNQLIGFDHLPMTGKQCFVEYRTPQSNLIKVRRVLEGHAINFGTDSTLRQS